MDELATKPNESLQLSEDARVPILRYIALLIVQHPTMMRARYETLRRRQEGRMGSLHSPRLPAKLKQVLDEMARGMTVLAVHADRLLTALELNYLSWRIVRWRGGPSLILGDSGVAASFADKWLGYGDAWSPGAAFALPLDPRSMLLLGGFNPGLCVVEEREAGLEVDALNLLSWSRSRSQVFARDRTDLERTLALFGQLDPRSDHSVQFAVREAVLPDFRIKSIDDLRIIGAADPLLDDTRARFKARFLSLPMSSTRGTDRPNGQEPSTSADNHLVSRG